MTHVLIREIWPHLWFVRNIFFSANLSKIEENRNQTFTCSFWLQKNTQNTLNYVPCSLKCYNNTSRRQKNENIWTQINFTS